MPTHPPPSQTTLGSTSPEASHDTTESMTISGDQNTLLLYPAYDPEKGKITVRAATFLSPSEGQGEHPTLPQVSLVLASLDPALRRWEEDSSDDEAFKVGDASRIRNKTTELQDVDSNIDHRAWTVDSCATKECFERLITDCGGQEHTIKAGLGPNHLLIPDGPASNRHPRWELATGDFIINSQSEADDLNACWPRMKDMLSTAPNPISIAEGPSVGGILTLATKFLHEEALSHWDQFRLADLRLKGQFDKAACLSSDLEKETMRKLDKELGIDFFSGLRISHCTRPEYSAYIKVKDRFVK